MVQKKIIVFCLACLLVFPLLNSQQIKKLKRKPLATSAKFQFKRPLPDLTAKFISRIGSRRDPRIHAMKSTYGALIKNIGKAAARNFYVDFYKTTDNKLAVKGAKFNPKFYETYRIKNGRKMIKFLAPGASTRVYLPKNPSSFGIRDSFKPAKYFLAVYADSTMAVSELSEINNHDITQYFIFPANITQIIPHGYFALEYYGQMVLEIRGSGFGTTFTNKKVRLGSHILNIMESESSNTKVIGILSSSISFGVSYNVWITENGTRISNKFNHLLKIFIESCGRVVNNNIISSGPAGCTVRIYGNWFGASQGSLVVKFGTATANVVSWSNNQIDIICPSLPPGGYDIHIENNGQDVTFYHGGFTITP